MKRRTNKKQMITPDLTPLIDVVFLLLIFFMLVTTFDKYSGFSIKLPKATIDDPMPAKDGHELIIDANKVYHFKLGQVTEMINASDFTTKFAGAESVTISADKNLAYEIVITAIGELKNSGIEKVELNLND